MPENEYDVIVIGAGYGGVAVAASLASQDFKVLVIDKNKTAGGKAIRAHRDGTTYDLWPIAGGASENSAFSTLIDILGLEQDLIIQCAPAGEFIYVSEDGTKRSWTADAYPGRDAKAAGEMFSALELSLWRTGGLIPYNLINGMMPERFYPFFDTISMEKWMRMFRMPKPIFSFLANLMMLFFVVPLDRLPVSVAMRTMRDTNRNGAGRYHRHGYGDIAEKAVRFVEERGGACLSGTRVEKVLTKDGKAIGVETASGKYFAPVVVSNAGIQPTVLKLTGEAQFPASYIERVKTLEPSLALVGIRYHLDAPVFSVPLQCAFSDTSWWNTERFEAAKRGDWPGDPMVFITTPSLYDPELGTEKCPQVALASTLCTADVDSPMNEIAVEKMDKRIRQLWPEIGNHITDQTVYTSKQVSDTTRDAVLPGQGGECIGLGQTIGQSGKTKPDARSPLTGLYFAGCDAGGQGIGTTQAVDSGLNVAAMIAEDFAALKA